MNIAYLISAYKDPQHLRRLIDVLTYDKKAVQCFVHVDAKVDIAPFEQLCTQSNVHFIKNRINIQWGVQSSTLPTGTYTRSTGL